MSRGEFGFAWVCQTCWRLYTTRDTITRNDRYRRHGKDCQGRNARRLAIGNDGFPLAGELAPGESVVGKAPRSCWETAATATQQVSAPSALTSVSAPPLPAPTIAQTPDSPSSPSPEWALGWLPVSPSLAPPIGYLYPDLNTPSPPPPHSPLPVPSDLPFFQRSRQTRHQDAASRSRQGHIIDLDPTDGLPVQKYGLQKIRVNQDASTDPSSTNPKSTSSAEWAAQFNTEQHPWPERPLPSYFTALPAWNQEMIRMARAGNTNPTLSVYDRKTNAWISGAEQERKAAAIKLNSLNPVDSTEKPQNGNDADSPKSGDESGAEDSSNEYNKSADEDEFDGDETTPFKPSSKRRKVTSRHHGSDDTRIIEVTKWVPLAPSQADKSQDRQYLAPRRPGLPAIYTNPEYAQKIFSQYLSSASYTGSSGYDLGEGGGLNNASGVLAAGTANDQGASTPRKNIPPRRKKKKLGGPGRKKANPNPGDNGNNPQSTTAGSSGQGTGTDAMEGVVSGDGQSTSGNTTRNPGYEGQNEDGTAQDDGDNDNDNDSGSEAEGSEEGEIDESGGATLEPVSEIPQVNEPSIQPPTTTATEAPPLSVHAEVASNITEPTETKSTDNVEKATATVASSPPIQFTTTTTTTEPITEPELITLAAPPTDVTPLSTTTPPTAIAAPEPFPVPIPQPTVTITDTDTNMDAPLPNPTNTATNTVTDTAMPDADATSQAQAQPQPDLNLNPISDPPIATQSDTTITTEPPIHALNLPPPQNAEESEIVEETARAITDNDDGVGVDTTGKKAEGKGKTEEAHVEGEVEVDFLGGLDAAIDREVSEGG